MVYYLNNDMYINHTEISLTSSYISQLYSTVFIVSAIVWLLETFTGTCDILWYYISSVNLMLCLHTHTTIYVYSCIRYVWVTMLISLSPHAVDHWVKPLIATNYTQTFLANNATCHQAPTWSGQQGIHVDSSRRSRSLL